MAEPRKRSTRHSASDDTEIQSWTDGIPLSPSWWAPAFITLLILGLIWLMVYYISGGLYPIPKIGAWNLLAGLGIMMAGFLVTLRWR